MSDSPTLVTAQHFQYLMERTRGDDPSLKELKQAAKAAGIPSIWVNPAQASFMQILLKLSGAMEVVDVGTLAGYSAITMARALPKGGRVCTLELVKKHADFARAWIEKSDVADKIELFEGNAREILPTFETNSADACFLDADKSGYEFYLKECLRIVGKGGLFMVDNAFAFGELFADKPTDPETPAVRRFNEIMAKEHRIHSVIVPLGDGCWVGIKE
ncbi:MAG: class I SAM-dependent methyltransferase [Planctomycetes bacterium]|nr:class I SAM-dependent methyltransferase [Planctomycetota bacterium]NUQ34449.1 class I SAM-dependent methyltransferase [Planctomycetaceae bacterium]